jgi:hypothetical protein
MLTSAKNPRTNHALSARVSLGTLTVVGVKIASMRIT